MLVKSPVAVSTSLPSGRLAAMSPANTGLLHHQPPADRRHRITQAGMPAMIRGPASTAARCAWPATPAASTSPPRGTLGCRRPGRAATRPGGHPVPAPARPWPGEPVPRRNRPGARRLRDRVTSHQRRRRGCHGRRADHRIGPRRPPPPLLSRLHRARSPRSVPVPGLPGLDREAAHSGGSARVSRNGR